jgi:hypothetical protein
LGRQQFAGHRSYGVHRNTLSHTLFTYEDKNLLPF